LLRKKLFKLFLWKPVGLVITGNDNAKWHKLKYAPR
jgi:hypothetical protein